MIVLTETENVLFVCVENAGRSQMAEAFFKNMLHPNSKFISAGTALSSQLNPKVVQVMAEIGITLDQQSPKLLSNDMIQDSLKTVNMGMHG